jgi:hypothetical protein
MNKPALPPLGSAERDEIETIYDRFFDGGYDLLIGCSESGWVTALHRHDLPGSSTSARARGATALEAVRAIWERYERDPDLNGVRADPAWQAKRTDSYFFLDHGTVMIRRGLGGSPWLVRWIPNQQAGLVWPPARISSEEANFPTDEGVAGVLRWVSRQPWAQKSAA